MANWRFLIRRRQESTDPAAVDVAQLLSDFGVSTDHAVSFARVFLVEADVPTSKQFAIAGRIANELLTDAVVEECVIETEDSAPASPENTLVVEVHFKPGVMDSVADSTQATLTALGIACSNVRTGRRIEIHPFPPEREVARIRALLGNSCIEDVVTGTQPLLPARTPAVAPFELRHIRINDLSDADLVRLSRDGHMFLSLDEMRAIRDYFDDAGRQPTDLELETLAQTWSEHCVHKTLKSAFEYRGAPFPLEAATGCKTAERGLIVRRYSNLLKDTIACVTNELMEEGRGPECLSVFEDNAGIIGFDKEFGVAFKVETHNHPSAIEPYGGAATGVGGCIRDILGCGLGAKPIANTDVFCVAPPDWPVDDVPKGVIHPKTVLKGVVRGVRDYGNRMGIPTVSGAVYFDPRYLGNPLVYCGCVGLIPRSRIAKSPRPGDAIVLIGGRTGRDGIHGATFSSAELTDTHTDEFAHAVQIGNPIEEKKILDTLLIARDYGSDANDESECLYSAVTDCGAGGLSSAVGEMAQNTGADVHLERVPLKYAGLRYDEIWISEAQERMVLSVPPERIETLLKLFRDEDVEATVIGTFTDSGRLIVKYKNTVVGDLNLDFVHEGVPSRTLVAEWQPSCPNEPGRDSHSDPPNKQQLESLGAELKRRLGDPGTASKHWIIRQYDHEVQGRSAVKPLVGPRDGPSDAAVIRPRLDSNRGIAIGCGLAPDLYDRDPYLMAVAAVDEALRNVVCVGGDPARTAILDNFCWPRVDNPKNLGALVRACQACYDVAKAYGLPFISGKDSLNNEFALEPGDIDRVRRVIEQRYMGPRQGRSNPRAAVESGRLAIPGTLLISSVSLIDDVSNCVTMDVKGDVAKLYLVGQPSVFAEIDASSRPAFDLTVAARTHRTVAELIRRGLARSVHDISEGGPLLACAEMCMAGDKSAEFLGHANWTGRPVKNAFRSCRMSGGKGEPLAIFCFDSFPAGYIVEAAALSPREDELHSLLETVPSMEIASISARAASQGPILTMEDGESVLLADLRTAWRAPLDL